MVVLAVGTVHLIRHGASRHVHLATDDGLDALLFALFVKVDDTVHRTVVGDGQGRLTQLLGASHQPRNTAGAVQQRIFGVYV